MLDYWLFDIGVKYSFIIENLAEIRNSFLDSIFSALTVLGNGDLIIVALICIYMAVDKDLAQKFCFIMITSFAVNTTIKNMGLGISPTSLADVECVKPELESVYSFPSSITQTVTTWTTFLALELRKKKFAAAAAALILIIGFAELYMALSGPIDVVAAIVLGVLMSWLCGFIYDSFRDKRTVYIGFFLLMIPIIAFCLLSPSIEIRGIFQFAGVILGMGAGLNFEKKYVSFSYDTTRLKKILRCIIGVLIVFALKEGLKMFYFTEEIIPILLLDTLRYFIMVFVLFGPIPLLLKKFNL